MKCGEFLIADFDSCFIVAGFFAFLLVNWYIVFPIGAATGYLMDRIVNKEPTAT